MKGELGMGSSPDIDKCGLMEIDGKQVAILSSDRTNQGWRICCEGCGKLIAGTEEGLEAYVHPTDERRWSVGIADCAWLWCHRLRKDNNYDYEPKDIFERTFMNLDHPCLCKDCTKELEALGWGFCDCGCGG